MTHKKHVCRIKPAPWRTMIVSSFQLQWFWSSGSNFMKVSSSPDSHKDENQSIAFLLVLFWVGILKYVSVLSPPSSTSTLSPPLFSYLLHLHSYQRFPFIISQTLLHQFIPSQPSFYFSHNKDRFHGISCSINFHLCLLSFTIKLLERIVYTCFIHFSKRF